MKTAYIKRDDMYNLFGQNGIAHLHVADIDILPTIELEDSDIAGAKAIEILKELHESAKIFDLYQDDIFADYRNLAQSEMRDIINTLLNLKF